MIAAQSSCAAANAEPHSPPTSACEELVGDRGAGERAEHVHRCREQHRLAGAQHLGRDHGRDRIGRVVETVDVLERECDHHDEQNERQRHNRFPCEVAVRSS
jgi:hypothetical protein